MAWRHARFASSASIRDCGAPAGASSTVAGSRLSFVAAGTIPPTTRVARRAALRIHDGLCGDRRPIRPDEAAVEATFVNRDAAATLKLGQARGIAMLVPARAGLPVAEYAPNAVKKAVVGAGHAEKGRSA